MKNKWDTLTLNEKLDFNEYIKRSDKVVGHSVPGKKKCIEGQKENGGLLFLQFSLVMVIWLIVYACV